MFSWLLLAFLALFGIAVLAVLGAPIAFALRTRGFTFILVSVAAAFAVLALSPILASFIGIPWSLLPPAILTAVLMVLLILLRRPLGLNKGHGTGPRRSFWKGLGGAALGGGLIAFLLFRSMGNADAVVQAYDTNFHLNAVRQILETADASPFQLDIAVPGQPVFYPAVWHAFTSLLAQVPGVSIPLATNTALFVVMAVVWPLGVVALGRAIAGSSTRATISAGIAAAAFPTFPAVLMAYGIVYPYTLSIALLPFAIVGLLHLLDLAAARRSDPIPTPAAYLFMLGSLGAATLAHPSALHNFLLLAVFPVIAAAFNLLKARAHMQSDGLLIRTDFSRTSRISRAVLLCVGLVVAICIAWCLGRTSYNDWEGSSSPIGAFIDGLGSAPRLEGHNWPVSVLVLLGAILAWRSPRLRWTIGSAVLSLGWFVVGNGFPSSSWRTALLQPWYSDSWRVAPLVVLAFIPLAVVGTSTLMASVRTGLRRWTVMSCRIPTRRLFALIGILFLIASTQSATAELGGRFAKSGYVDSEGARLLSHDERTLLERLPEHVPEGEVLVNNPWNGGSLAYAIAGYQVLVPVLGGNYDPRIEEMTSELSRGTNRACQLAADLGVHYVLDFGRDYVFIDTPRAEPYKGISGVRYSKVLELVDREGDAKLYRITC